MESSSKKILIAVAIAFSLMAFAAMAYFIVVPKKEIVAENKSLAITPQLNSFRGVLAGTLHDAKEDVVKIGEKIGEAVSSPFVSTRTDPPETTSTETSGENSFSFAILGDTQYFTAGNPQGNFQKAVAQIQKQNPDLIVAVGDLVSNCKGKSDDARDYANWKIVLGTLLSKTYAVQGNHDRVENVDKCDRFWTDAFNFPTNGPNGFTEFAYSFDVKNSHFVFLDSSKPDGHQVNKTQRDWLEKDLAASRKENVFVVFHEPAYPTGYKAGESLDFDPSERNALWEILDRHNVTAVFNGHEHIVSRRKIDSKVSSVAKNSVYQFIFGSTDSFDHTLPAAGVAEYSNQGQGRFGLVKVNGKEVTVETHGPDGAILNSFTFSK